MLQVFQHDSGGDQDGGREPRVGFTASRKVGNAVARNRARRRLRAAAREVMPNAARAGHDYVIVARGATLARPYRALVGDLEEAMRRLGAHRGGRGCAPTGESAR